MSFRERFVLGDGVEGFWEHFLLFLSDEFVGCGLVFVCLEARMFVPFVSRHPAVDDETFAPGDNSDHLVEIGEVVPDLLSWSGRY